LFKEEQVEVDWEVLEVDQKGSWVEGLDEGRAGEWTKETEKK
jgi:homoserine kinase